MNSRTDLTRSSSPNLADPVACGEDLLHNLERAMQIGPETCPGCSDYHIAHTAKRLTGRTVWARGGREALLGTFRPILAELAAGDTGPIEVVIAASADTAVLSTCAHASWTFGEALSARTRFTVLDRCRTPLVLCEDYAERHGLMVATDTADLTMTSKRLTADLVVLHNFLSYTPEDQHGKLLRTLASWLKPRGRLVLWNNLVTPENRGRVLLFLKAQAIDAEAMIRDGRIEIGSGKEELIARLHRAFEKARHSSHRVPDTEYVSRLLALVGLAVRSTEVMYPEGLVPDGAPVSFPCATIVAGHPA